MPEQYILQHCSPTLAGLKTANLFSVMLDENSNINEEIRELNKVLLGKGLRAIPVKKTDNNALIYLYRPDYLRKDLSSPDALKILREKGYECDNAERCIVQLVNHLSKDSTFPHEIGLFLGYPPHDVRGFMNSPKKGVKCQGVWKVYGDRAKAEKTFSNYKKCTEVYCRKYAEGRTLEQLIVRTENRL